jgi:orotate phosphoribosyltransferase
MLSCYLKKVKNLLMTPEQTLKEFKEAQAILKGHFILSSGLHSDTYMQCARVLMEPARADRLCKSLAQKITIQFGKDAFDLVVSPAMGGVIVGYELARQLGLPSIFCERENGQFTFRRGFEVPQGARVLIVEDVVTTGKSSIETIECVTALGGRVVAEASLVNRNKGTNPLPIPLISLLEIEVKTFAADQVPAELAGVPAVKPGSRFLKK